MALDVVTYALSKKFTKDSLIGLGAVMGAPCTIYSIEPETRAGQKGNLVTFEWEDTTGTVHQGEMFVLDGVSIKNIAKTSTSGLVDTYTITYTDNRTTTFTVTNGKDGKDGVGVPSGGSKGQMLVKKSGADFDTEWKDAQGGDVPIATKDVAGKVKPDGTTITIENDGTIHSVGGSGGSSKTKKAITASIEVGGIAKGRSFPIGTDYDDLWDSLLNKVLYPTFTAPSASLSYSVDTYVAVGATISAKSATLSYNAGAITLDGVKQADRGGEATNFAIATIGADTEYSDSSEESGSFSVPALTKSSKGTIKITGTVSYGAGPQPKDSKGDDYDSPLSAGTISSEKTVNFILPFYYGVSNTNVVESLTGLTPNVTPKGNKSFSFTTNNQHMVVVYDSAYGNLKSILDPNGFEVIGGWTKSTLTVDGFSYFVYVADSKTTDTNATFTFKF